MNSWERNVQEWIRIYGKPKTQLRTFDPTKIKVGQKCAKKGCKAKKLFRHHKGHEYLLACLLPDVYAARYLEFHSDDVVRVCRRHHGRLHDIYSPIIDKFMVILTDARTLEQQMIMCEQLREALRKTCDIYLSRGKRKWKTQTTERSSSKR